MMKGEVTSQMQIISIRIFCLCNYNLVEISAVKNATKVRHLKSLLYFEKHYRPLS